MSLRAFHLLFIALSVVLTAFFAAWAVGQYQTAHDPIYVVACIGSLVLGIVLAFYGVMFQRKMRRLS